MDKPKSMGEYLEMTDAQKMQAAGLCSPAPDGSPDDFRKVRECIGLLDSMVRCGEDHDDDTERRVADALKIVVRIEANKSSSLERAAAERE